ncbi:unnamed protein product [Hydatigera taeniaeformis]|uniref:Alpha-MPP n=1 Tax=Hydatigena taeniaeformis TaxID=6205 RepID=A0A0R3X9K0_HYDTA|nr:unnamed protein product [Hydatigera taeniaeformis]
MLKKSNLLITTPLKLRDFSTCVPKVPLSQALLGFTPTFSSTPSSRNSAVIITKLGNGLTVASQNKFGMHCTIGGMRNVYDLLLAMLRAGPRYESGTVSGVSHFLEKLGFHSTDRFRDRDHIQSKMESCNAIFDCQISRDFIVYAISGLNKHLVDLVNVLSETTLRPKITKNEVDMAARAIGFELSSLEMAPPTEPILNDLLHSAAFHGCNTLGFPRYCPAESIDSISRREIMQFMASYYRPERMVVVGVGVDHNDFVNLVESSFVPWETSYGLEVPKEDRLTVDDSLPVYSGGEITVRLLMKLA